MNRQVLITIDPDEAAAMRLAGGLFALIVFCPSQTKESKKIAIRNYEAVYNLMDEDQQCTLDKVRLSVLDSDNNFLSDAERTMNDLIERNFEQ